MRVKKLLTIAAVLSALYLLGTCSLEGDIFVPRTNPEPPPSNVITLYSVSANGSYTQTTSQLTLSFSSSISGLSASDITLSGNLSGVSRGSLSGSNPYYLNISGVSASGYLYVSVAKSGYTISGGYQYVEIYYYAGSNPTPVNPGLVRIQGGTFTMGSPSNESGRWDDEGPQHQVTVSSFYMGKYEVTQAEYQSVMGTNPSYFTGSNLPVESVTWYEAVEYCNRLSQREGLTSAYQISGTNVTCNWNANGYRLPTEAEWEYACRAGTTTAYNTGNTISTNTGWYWDNSNSTTHPVGQKPANAWGLYDMHGNVWEWCWDWYGSYSSGTQTNPRGPTSGSNRVARGGSWCDDGLLLRSADRYGTDPSPRGSWLGFRLVRP